MGSLEQGIPYYFRVSALNANGQGPASLASPAFAVPLPDEYRNAMAAFEWINFDWFALGAPACEASAAV